MEIKPCPCCGSVNVTFKQLVDEHSFVMCENCGLMAESLDTEPDADPLTVWNRRVNSDLPSQPE